MDKASFQNRLGEGLFALQITVPDSVSDALWRYQEELLKWNSKVNLTAIATPGEVIEKHFIDSLAALPEVKGALSLLDLGAGAGLPGIPLALAEPQLHATLVDSVEKKVTFIKVASAALGLGTRVRALHRRAEADPAKEKIDLAQIVISRAFRALPDWLPLAKHYVAPHGRVVAMLGKSSRDEVEKTIADHGGTLKTLRTYALPFSRAERAIAVVAFGS
ncbi:MAG: 16S rRNA (guanine(527)-N(7))-methyltransferase RsmG [Myxococcaceae bacterium]